MSSINIAASDGSGSLLAVAPVSIPYFNKEQLYFYITYHDPYITVTGISDAGVLSYMVNSLPNYDAFVNVVFLIR